MHKASDAAARPWLFVGTVPEADFPLYCGPFTVTGDRLRLGPRRCAVNRGTPAMLAAARLTLEGMGAGLSPESLYVLAAGDTGDGRGSREVYRKLAESLPQLRPRGLTFHYLLPDVDWHNRILLALDELPEQPLLAADAGYMYAAKMSGYATRYDLFTPDAGELAFLADESAPHPFYTRNFLLANEDEAEKLLAKAYEGKNAARHMLVKGGIDRYAHDGAVLEEVKSPDVPMMEPIGGTGDTLTGIVSVLLAYGMDMRAACASALKINRRMGELARPTPASSVMDLAAFLPSAVHSVMETRCI